jgi:nitrogen fixation protein NifB
MKDTKMNSRLDLNRHPCFSAEVKGSCGRVHLPVAPKCNIKCNYCNRKYDCVNESRPGVTSAVLSPFQAIRYLEEVMKKEPRITVAGIAGPGDPLANPSETVETLRLIRKRFPEMLLCLATNGLALLPLLPELVETGVSHVTITVNAVDPKIGQAIYGWVRDGKVIYRGVEAAGLLIERQLEGIRALVRHGIAVKVNTIVVPGINEDHIEEVAVKSAELGASILNCMPMHPNRDAPFEGIPEPTKERMDAIRSAAQAYLPQMRHCTRCRADAVGLLDSDRSHELRGYLSACSKAVPASEEKPYVAAASLEGILVNQHLGEAARFLIWEEADHEFRLVEERAAPAPGTGIKRWLTLAEVIKDCRAVLVSGIGERPKEILQRHGILPVEMNGFIESGLQAIYRNDDSSLLKGRRRACAKGTCSGEGGGCM